MAEASRKIRNRFVLKVYLLLTVQLAITASFCALFLSVSEVKVWVQQNYWLIWVNLIPTIIVIIALAYKKRSYPLNIILLLVFTILESYTVATISARFWPTFARARLGAHICPRDLQRPFTTSTWCCRRS